jgi:hypothetical protein
MARAANVDREARAATDARSAVSTQIISASTRLLSDSAQPSAAILNGSSAAARAM